MTAATLVWPDERPFDGYVWDHWRVGSDEAGHALYAALIDYGAGWRLRVGAGTHHHAASWALLRRVSAGDPERFEILQPDLLCGNPDGPDDACVWSGGAARTTYAPADAEPETVHALFYTARTLSVPRTVLADPAEMAQHVRLAVLRQEDLPGGGGRVLRVRRTGLVLHADPERHVGAKDAGAVAPAFRDPCLFTDHAGQPYLVVATRERSGPPHNDASLSFYAVEGPLDRASSYRYVGAYAPGCYVEMECPHVAHYDDRLVLTFSTGGQAMAPAETKEPTRGLMAVHLTLNAEGGLIFRDERLRVGDEQALWSSSRGLYAGWIDDGQLRGFSLADGGLVRAGPAPWFATEDLDLTRSTKIVGPLGRTAELTDATHQWDLRRAALFVGEWTDEQKRRMRAGEKMLAVLDPTQKKRLDAFYAGTI